MSNDATQAVKAACTAAAGRLLAQVTEERKAVCVIRALRVFETAEQFPRSLFLSTDDKAGFVVWATIGTPYKTPAVQQFIDGIVSEARTAYAEICKARAAVAETADLQAA